MKYYLKKFLVFDIIFLVTAYATIFNQLDKHPINDWDESIYCTNTLEMAHNGQYIVKYFDHKPEMWGTEPPLFSWIQLLFTKLLGFNEVALRLPSAVATFLLALLLISFGTNELKCRYIGYFSAMVLITSKGFVGYHVSRTADLDALLSFSLFFYVLNFFKYIRYLKIRYLYFTFIGLLCAVFTKSIAGFFFLPPLFVFALITGNGKEIFRSKHFYIILFSFLVAYIGYYLLRESQNHGYIATALKNEVTARFMKVNEGHDGPFLYHYYYLKENGFSQWFFFILLGVLFLFIKRKVFDIRLSYYLISCTLFLWLLISFSATKIYWYSAPLFPFMSLFVGIAIYHLFKAGDQFFSRNIYLIITFNTLFLSSLFYYPYRGVVEANNVFREDNYGHFLKKLKEENPEYQNLRILSPGFRPSLYYYAELFEYEHKYNIKIIDIMERIEIHETDTIIYGHPVVSDKLNKEFNYRLINQYGELKFVVVNGKK